MITDTLSTPVVSTQTTTDWHADYRGKLWFTDSSIIIAVVFLTQFTWFTFAGAPVSGDVGNHEWLNYSWLSVVLILAWLAALSISGSRSSRVVGVGAWEYRQVVTSALYLFALLAILSYVTFTPISRGYMLIAFPVGTAALLLNRVLWRRWLQNVRRSGSSLSRVLVLGDDEESSRIIAELDRTPQAGYRVVAVSGPGRRSDFKARGVDVPFLGPVGDVGAMLEQCRADTVIVASDAALPVQKVREISWGLIAGRQHLIMVPSLTDIGGPRIHTRPVAGLPLMHVETPRFTGFQRLLKRSFDVVGSGLLLLALAPLLGILALLIKASSHGPVFYTQERVGKAGDRFQMIKFRSMVPDADGQLKALLAEQGTGDQPLFKIENDPRITPIGRILRKYSLDEFPQLINVFRGDMSLVGPRPQRKEETAFYDAAAERRLIVKPGMSGLWQVSGRSLLSWEEAMRLDLYYVENWSLVGDIAILLRTVKAVVAPGATAH